MESIQPFFLRKQAPVIPIPNGCHPLELCQAPVCYTGTARVTPRTQRECVCGGVKTSEPDYVNIVIAIPLVNLAITRAPGRKDEIYDEGYLGPV